MSKYVSLIMSHCYIGLNIVSKLLGEDYVLVLCRELMIINNKRDLIDKSIFSNNHFDK